MDCQWRGWRKPLAEDLSDERDANSALTAAVKVERRPTDI
jgi:hypothetical protein